MKNKNVWFTILMLAVLGSALQAAVVIRTEVEPTGGPYTSVSSDNRIESQNVNTNYMGNQSLKWRNANANRVIIPFCRFDLSSLSGVDLSGTTFSHTITWESQTSTVTLDVWGIIDGANDYWDASTLTWTTATSTLGWLTWTTDGSGTYTNYTPNESIWQKLGTVTFTVTAGSPNLMVTTNPTNCNLDSFLAADTNGLVTLALMASDTRHWCNICSADNVAAGSFPEAYAPSLTIPIGPFNPEPADDITIVDYASLTQLCWETSGIPRYEVWFGAADANELDYQSALTHIATIDDPASSVCADIPAGMLPLTAPQTYTWVLDSYVYPASDPNHTGDPNQLLMTNLFQFATSSVPTVNTDPDGQYKFPAETATFTAVFDAITPVTAVTWYKDDVAVDTGDADVTVTLTNGTENQYTSTLTIEHVELADEGAYSCVAENSGGISDPTGVAYLVIKRMLAHWDFDGDADDETGVYNGTLMGDPNFVTDGSRQAIQLDGDGDYVDLPDGFDNFLSGLTFTVWAKTAAVTTWARFIDIGNNVESVEGVDDIFLGRNASTTTLRFDFAPWPGAVDATNAIVLNEWQMFVVTMDEAGNVVIYNGFEPVQTGTVSAMPTVATRTNNFIGESNWASDSFYNGMIDDMRVYNYALTEDDVADLYAAAVGTFCRTSPEYDLSGNCVVDIADFVMIAEQWMTCGLWPECLF